MAKDPLAQPPHDSPLSKAFLTFAGLKRGEPDADFLEAVARAFARLPYENLTKIIKHKEAGDPIRARREPPEVFGDHVRWRTGGTCFSLTAFLLHLVRSFGYQAEPVLADRRYGPNTHCAVLVNLDGKTHLVDPGYLVFRPLLIPRERAVRISTPFNEIVLKPEQGGDRLALSTCRQGSEVYRLTFKLPGADPAEFMRAWHESFSWDMMRYPVLTCCRDGRQLYLQDTLFQERDRARVDRQALAFGHLPELIAERFGLAPEVIIQALEIVKREEKRHD